MLTESVETMSKLSDFDTVTAAWWQYTSHIHELHICTNMFRGAYSRERAKNPCMQDDR